MENDLYKDVLHRYRSLSLTEAALTALLFIRSSPGFACYIFIIWASDMVLSIFDILYGFIYLGGTRGPPS